MIKTQTFCEMIDNCSGFVYFSTASLCYVVFFSFSFSYSGSDLLIDFFLDETDPASVHKTMVDAGLKPKFDLGGGSSDNVSKTFDQVKAVLNEDLVKSVGGVFMFDLSG